MTALAYSCHIPRHKAIGEEALKYLASDPGMGLGFGPDTAVEEHGEYAQLPVTRRRGAIEVHCDGAFAASAPKSMTGVVVKHGGVPVLWVSMRQSLTCWSTAEAELEAQLEALLAGRSLRSLVEIFEGHLIVV